MIQLIFKLRSCFSFVAHRTLMDSHVLSVLFFCRIGLLNRIALLYVINFLSHTFYLIYLNVKENIFCYLFSITSILLVSEQALNEKTFALNSLRVEKTIDYRTKTERIGLWLERAVGGRNSFLISN